MTSQEEASSTSRGFFHDVEERCLRTYDRLVIQNASDIARESDRLRNDADREKKQKKKRQGEAIKRPEEEASGAADGAYRGKHLRMGLADLPPAPGQALGVRSQSLDSVGGDADERKQPPPKPKRDPGTKLSGSSEALHAQDEGERRPAAALVGTPLGGAATVGPFGPTRFSFALRLRPPRRSADACLVCSQFTPTCAEDWRRTPPPKPKRNPDTQLSSSFDEGGAGGRGKETSPGRGRSPAPRDEPESVYIEMAANVAAESRDDPDESVYEEMKYSESRASPRRIPQPFPNLLTHRPPLLVFPPFPPPRSPNSDESPLTPVDVTRLSMAGKRAGHPGGSKRGADQEERPPARNVAPSGRSSAPPSAPSTSAQRPAAAERRSGRGAEEFKRLHPLGRSSSASGAPSTPRDHPALGQMPWLCGDVTMMETIEKKRVLCGEIKSRRRADKNPGQRDALPAGAPAHRRKQPPPYPAAVLWDTAI
ncbi:LOW QUALITY PROTEIN: neuronal tyrosine-phosphorylated phosphoinositide-3-kinase adapter 2-like [Hippocampus comes]|uniref:LOW QUALITY PROTEIN: neuronal tyrosine-phosphorylated phosphoinositide-3-kinase adapter 2-like n=1 Tax=Hippocampus comes TaxID=109280 RepID=UPI00094E0F62|nr:PREDICTED: LOW QUALITY PROTEIN: neuronal tyrosine-phosphorylated phosphoinositide-3-kinase adapter 2-like [Hippocampus comes]